MSRKRWKKTIDLFVAISIPSRACWPIHNSIVESCNLLGAESLYSLAEEAQMFLIAILVCLLLFLALAGASLLVANINPDELIRMGVEKKS
jgi:hypothetical protein